VGFGEVKGDIWELAEVFEAHAVVAITYSGEEVKIIQDLPIRVVSFPIQHRWGGVADLDLIRQSAKRLMALVNEKKWTKVLMPRPSFEREDLDWETEVKPILEDVLDRRVAVVSHATTKDAA